MNTKRVVTLLEKCSREIAARAGSQDIDLLLEIRNMIKDLESPEATEGFPKTTHDYQDMVIKKVGGL
jgi:hypothetical protein